MHMAARMQEENLSNKKSRNGGARLQVKTVRAELFLERIANLPRPVRKARAESLAKAFSDLMPRHMGFTGRSTAAFTADGEAVPPRPLMLLKSLSAYLQDGWEEPSLVRRKLTMMRMAGTYMAFEETPEFFMNTDEIDKNFPQPRDLTPEPDMFVSVLLYALEHAHLLKYCQNPGCREPYFIAERVSQNVCSVACAKPIQREAKRRWWQEHGEDWRRKQKAAERSSRKSQRKGGKRT